MSLKAAKEALTHKKYTEAIAILSAYCQAYSQQAQGQDYIQAQMWLVSAYQNIGRADKAVTICEKYLNHGDPQLQAWAHQALKTAKIALEFSETPTPEAQSVVKSKPNRYRKSKVILSLQPYARLRLILAMVSVVCLILGIFIAIGWGIISLVFVTLTTGWKLVVVGITLIFGIILFFMSPWLIDITHKQFYRTQWLTLADLEPKAPEAVAIIEEFCQARNMDIPKIGWVEDHNPVAFLYGVLPNSVRLIVSHGLFEVLDDEEIAVVVAHQLGRVANWSFAVTTFVAAPAQIIYVIHVWLSRIGIKVKVAKHFWQIAAAIFLGLYRFLSSLAFGLSRSSAYVCDHFAAEITGNPNALSRALTKISRGLVNHAQQVPSRLLESTPSFGICDFKTSASVGKVFQILYSGYSGMSQQNLYQVFLWELFNPWAIWIELQTPQPLIGRRIKALTMYAHQLGLTEEYEFRQLLTEGKTLNLKLLRQNFVTDLLIHTAPYTLPALGLVAASAFFWLYNSWLPLSLVAIGLGIGIMLQGSLNYPDFAKVTSTNFVNLLINPYTNPLRGMPVQIPGEIIGYSVQDLPDYDLKLEDQSSIFNLSYMLGIKTYLGNPVIVQQKLESLVGETVLATGWFRRSHQPILDLSLLQPILANQKSKPLHSYHQFWNNLVSSAMVLGGLGLLAVTSIF